MSTRIWHNTFKNDWMRAFPLGNGRIGAMLYGNPDCEQIQINEESLWSGKQLEEKCNSTPEKLQQIRELLFDGKFKEAKDVCFDTFLSNPPKVRFYETFGDIFIDFKNKGDYTGYVKELELTKAIADVSYNKADMQYHSETFISEKYDVLIHKMCADSGKISCSITMRREQDACTFAADDNTLFLDGKIMCKKDEKYGDEFEGMSFGAKIHIESDGICNKNGSSVTVTDATYIVLYGAFATNYNVKTFDIDETIDYRLILDKQIEKVKITDYNKIKKEHTDSHLKWFDTVCFNLEGTDYSDIPTDIRLKRVQEDNVTDNDLYTLYYNFGRYLLIESSGKRATLPANLQGIWCNEFTPPWGSDYHTNINLQMNYWPAECANMSDTFNPFIHFMKMISHFGKKTAARVFNANGWVINHTTDIFGRTGVHDWADCGFYPLAGAWLCLNLWEHYEYTNSIEYLKDIYPILKESCEFIKSYLVKDKNGMLVSCPSNSPENKFYYIDENGNKETSMFTYGTTMDNQIIYAILKRTICACSILDCDNDFAYSLENILKSIPPMRISERYGTICEWIEDYEETEPGHRHISHLFGLYPSYQINENNTEIYEAAKRTIERRLSNGGAATGWSRAWVINFYARFKDGQKACENLKYLLKLSTAENLFDMHPPFQIDGNFGAVSGITEMLIQSHLGTPGKRIIELLPALPDSWQSGSICGIKARGNFEFDISWKNKKITYLKVSSHTCSILYLKSVHGIDTKKYTHDNNIFEIPMSAGQTIQLI